MSIGVLSVSEVLNDVLAEHRELGEAYEAAESITECPGCGWDDDMDGRIIVTVAGGDEYLVPCPLLQRTCRYGQALGERLDRHALGNAKSVPGVPMRFFEALKDPKPTAGVRGVNAWRQSGFLLIFGDHGTGKSFSAAYALYVLARRVLLNDWKYPSAWGSFSAMWVSAYRATTKDDIFETARTTPVLVLDDLGSEEPTNRAKARITEIISERYNHKKITVLTTNYDSLELENVYGKRMSDRILGDGPVGHTVNCTGESLRLTP